MQPEIVFVDPQDPNEPFWWPAIIVSPQEYDHFFKQMGEPIEVFGNVLVCYFEDASYSAVSESEVKKFVREDPFFVKYFGSKAFMKTKGAKIFRKYIEEGKVPSKFKWLKNKRKYVRKSEGCFKKKYWVERARQNLKEEEGCQ